MTYIYIFSGFINILVEWLFLNADSFHIPSSWPSWAWFSCCSCLAFSLIASKHWTQTRCFVVSMLGRTTLWGEQLPQTSFPHILQWCLLFNKLNSHLQRVQLLAVLSGCHMGASASISSISIWSDRVSRLYWFTVSRMIESHSLLSSAVSEYTIKDFLDDPMRNAFLYLSVSGVSSTRTSVSGIILWMSTPEVGRTLAYIRMSLRR